MTSQVELILVDDEDDAQLEASRNESGIWGGETCTFTILEC